ncbi:unnamed protein product [Linum trigynum]|uniref:Uncharacterized protein n=1 Tax=Linum trigynum TaxID=586398 RepID=A0AAV2FDU4_9ROSI
MLVSNVVVLGISLKIVQFEKIECRFGPELLCRDPERPVTSQGEILEVDLARDEDVILRSEGIQLVK